MKCFFCSFSVRLRWHPLQSNWSPTKSFTSIRWDNHIDFPIRNKFIDFPIVFVCRLDSYALNDYKSGYFALDHSNEQNDINTNYNNHNGTDTRWAEFKAPMPIRNGSNHHRIPALISAKSQAFDGTTIFNRSKFNKPQQTINPHYNRFGEPSELSSFKNVPDLYPIKANTSTANASYLSSNSLSNGYEQPLFATPRYANDTCARSVLSASNSVPSTGVGRQRSLFLNSTLNNKNSTTYNTMGSKSNATLYNVSQFPYKNQWSWASFELVYN